MKTTLSLAAAALLLVGLTVSQPAMSQDKGGQTTQGGNRNQGKVRPNFVDANGDGICDNNTTGTCQGGGTGTGTGIRKRLRDGSCGTGTGTPATGTNTGAQQRRRSAK